MKTNHVIVQKCLHTKSNLSELAMCTSAVMTHQRKMTALNNYSNGSNSCNTVTPLLISRRHAGVELTSSLAKLGQSKALAEEIKAGRLRQNKEIVASFDKIQSIDKIHYRKTERPWELVPRYARKRVTDLVGLLSSEDRMEIEIALDKMQSLCKTEMYVVLVPTVGFVSARVFANSIFYNWAIGEPQGNGLLLVIAQHEHVVQLISSLAIEEYFSEKFLEPIVREIFQPLVQEGKSSYAVVQLVYAIARQAMEMHKRWESGLVPMPVRNKVRFAERTLGYGIFQVPYLVMGCVFFTLISVWLVSQLMDTVCPHCRKLMHRVTDDALLQRIMNSGEYLELKNQCAYYRVWKCPYCEEGQRVTLCSRDLHQSDKCLQCMDCKYYTCSMDKEIIKMPTKHEDGIKHITYDCANCHSHKEVDLPLFRPVDDDSNGSWYDFLLKGSQSHKTQPINLKL